MSILTPDLKIEQQAKENMVLQLKTNNDTWYSFNCTSLYHKKVLFWTRLYQN